MSGVEEQLNKQNPQTWVTVTDTNGPFHGGLFCSQAVTLVLKDIDDNTESFSFIANQFVPLDIKEVVSGATGNGVIGFN